MVTGISETRRCGYGHDVWSVLKPLMCQKKISIYLFGVPVSRTLVDWSNKIEHDHVALLRLQYEFGLNAKPNLYCHPIWRYWGWRVDVGVALLSMERGFLYMRTHLNHPEEKNLHNISRLDIKVIQKTFKLVYSRSLGDELTTKA